VEFPKAQVSNVDGFGESDEESFIRERVCPVTLHSVTPETSDVLHHSGDNPSAAVEF
jgi:hypothetical protein